jgi:hypothetical protein
MDGMGIVVLEVKVKGLLYYFTVASKGDWSFDRELINGSYVNELGG